VGPALKTGQPERFLWQKTIPRAKLKHFWEHMADRARGGKVDQDRD